jgi:hypothetical protein
MKSSVLLTASVFLFLIIGFTVRAEKIKLGERKLVAQGGCRSVPNAVDEYRALNSFWGTNISICRVYSSPKSDFDSWYNYI